MTHLTGEDAVKKLATVLFQISIERLLEEIRPKLGRDIWSEKGILSSPGSSVIATFLSNLSKAYPISGIAFEPPDYACRVVGRAYLDRDICYYLGHIQVRK